MKYRVHIKWSKVATVEADSREDAINQVLHSAQNPKLHRTHAYRESRKEQTVAALPKWKALHALRKDGMKLQDIADKEGMSLRCVARALEKYQSHLLNQKAA